MVYMEQHIETTPTINSFIFTLFPTASAADHLANHTAEHIIMPLALWQHLTPTLTADQRNIIEHAAACNDQLINSITIC